MKLRLTEGHTAYSGDARILTQAFGLQSLSS